MWPGGESLRGETVHFKAAAALGFPASSIKQLKAPASPEDAAQMWVNFFGMTGPSGVLPYHYSEEILRGKKSEAFADFLNIFNHRFLSFFYQAWEKHHFAIPYERDRGERTETKGLTRYLYDLVGLGTAGLEGRLEFGEDRLLFYAGLVWQRPLSAMALAGVLADYFGIPVQVEQFRGRWLALESSALADMVREDHSSQLGFGAMAGDAVWNIQTRFRICAGPLRLPRFLDLLPGGRSFRALTELTQFLTGPTLEFEVQLILAAQDVPACKLHDAGSDAPRLGLLSWLGDGEAQFDKRDTEYSVVWSYESSAIAA